MFSPCLLWMGQDPGKHRGLGTQASTFPLSPSQESPGPLHTSTCKGWSSSPSVTIGLRQACVRQEPGLSSWDPPDQARSQGELFRRHGQAKPHHLE